MATEATVATVALLAVTVSLPFYLYGAWVMLDAEVVTWELLVYHLKFIVTGLVLTTVPVAGWMMPRLLQQLKGLAVLHAFFGIQAYAMLAFALTGIVRIFAAKYRADLYRDPDPDVAVDDLGENMSHWRKRLRVGVAGYVVFWLLAYVLGVIRYALMYL